MISVSLQGGLGNQIFQIAAAYSLSLDGNFGFGIDLDNCNVPLQGKPAKTYARNIYYNIPKINHFDYDFKIYKEPQWEYTPIGVSDNLLLQGYFQSPLYFDHHKQNIIDLLLNDDIRYGILNRVQDMYEVELRNSVSLHIRRGDYQRFPSIHPITDISYFMEAISRIGKEREVYCILVFSDDIEWCKKEIRANNVRFVEGLSDLESLLLMSLCNHNIITNSSFSWWASYFNANPDKIVYAPKKWFGSLVNHGWDSIYEKNMRLL